MKKIFPKLYIEYSVFFVPVCVFLTLEVLFLFFPSLSSLIDWMYGEDYSYNMRAIARAAKAGLIGIPIGLVIWFFVYRDWVSEIKERSQERAWANVIADNNLISIKTLHGLWRSGFWDVSLPDLESQQSYLKSTSSDEELGEAVIAALSASKKINFEENEGYYKKERFLPLFEKYETQILEKFAYESVSDMDKCVLYCQISVKNDTIRMQPWRNKYEGLYRKRAIKYNIIHTPLSDAPSKIGASLRAALSQKSPKHSNGLLYTVLRLMKRIRGKAS